MGLPWRDGLEVGRGGVEVAVRCRVNLRVWKRTNARTRAI